MWATWDFPWWLTDNRFEIEILCVWYTLTASASRGRRSQTSVEFVGFGIIIHIKKKKNRQRYLSQNKIKTRFRPEKWRKPENYDTTGRLCKLPHSSLSSRTHASNYLLSLERSSPPHVETRCRSILVFLIFLFIFSFSFSIYVFAIAYDKKIPRHPK